MSDERRLHAALAGPDLLTLSFLRRRAHMLVLHCEEWGPPTVSVDLLDIESITPTFAQSILDDSYLDVKRKDGTVLTVKLDNGRGGDKKQYEALDRAWEDKLRRHSAGPSGVKS